MKEQIINLFTKDNLTKKLSERIKGDLDSVIISSDKMINIAISLDNFPIKVYENRKFLGSEYIPLRAMAFYMDKMNKDQHVAKWKLNDKLKILIIGSKGTKVKIILRYDSEDTNKI